MLAVCFRKIPLLCIICVAGVAGHDKAFPLPKDDTRMGVDLSPDLKLGSSIPHHFIGYNMQSTCNDYAPNMTPSLRGNSRSGEPCLRVHQSGSAPARTGPQVQESWPELLRCSVMRTWGVAGSRLNMEHLGREGAHPDP